MEQSIKVTIKALICRENMVLLAKDEKGKWEMPGGKLEFGESPEKALTRELNEELSAHNPKVGKLLDVWTFTVEKTDRKVHYVVLVYEVVLNDAQIIKSDEHVALEWIEKDRVNGLEMRDGYKNTINIFFKNKNI
jgi:8-oxo-dGTP diphosphatase